MKIKTDRFLGLLPISVLLAGALAGFSIARGAENFTEESKSDLGLTADLTFASKYMTDGFKVGGDHPVWEPSLSYDVLKTGFSVMAWSAFQIDRSNSIYDEIDFMGRYTNTFFSESSYALNFHGFYDFWIYPQSGNLQVAPSGSAPETRQGSKLQGGFSLPHAIPLAGSHLVPSYNLYYWIYWAQNQWDQYEGGTHHEISLQYFHEIPRLIPGSKWQSVGVTSGVNYNDGAFKVSPGWSHTTAQIGTSVAVAGGIFYLSLNRQWTYIESVDPNNEFWSTASYSREF